MKFLSLELKDYKRFSLNNINNFSIKFEENLQLILGTNGSGKAQPLDAFIKTPGNWKLMKEMQVGTEVISKDGTICKVTGVFPQGKKEIFKVTFSDGRTTECCAEHLWKVYIGGKKYPIEPTVMTTTKMNQYLSGKSTGHLVWIDLPDSEKNEDIDLPIDPYLLGVYLGDGCGVGIVTVITTPDDFIAKEIENLVPEGCVLKERILPIDKCKNYSIIKKEGIKGSNPFTDFLKDNNLFGKRSYEKSIPEKYLLASTKQRLSLLQGLMDTDGYIDIQSTCSYSTTSLDLAIQVQYLVRSLGGIASIVPKIKYFNHLGQKKQGRQAFQVNIRYKKPSELFRLPKKKDRANDNGQYCATLKLRVESIESIGFKEAQCISIDHPSKLYITNGFTVTHNSSLLEQLTPLPPDQKDFLKSGKKKITIQHNNSVYVLTSIFSPKIEHSFIVDDVECNIGGTITVQKELVKQHFNITPDIHDLILGKEKFSNMGFSRRKEWFIKICDTNYDYAIKVFNKLKERHRDITGAIKLAKKRLVIETEKLIKEDEEEKIKSEVYELHNTLSLLLEIRKPIEKDIDNILIEQEKLDDNLIKYTKTLSDLINQVNKNSLTIEEIESYIKEKDMELYSINNQITKLLEEYNTNEKKISILQKAEQDTIESLKIDINNLEKDKKVLLANLLIEPLNDPKSCLNVLETIKDNLIDIFNNIPINIDKKYSSQEFNKSKETLEQLNLKRVNSSEALNDLYVKIKHMENHRNNPDTECPSCKHKFSINYNEDLLTSWKKKVTTIEQFINTSLDVEINNIKTYLEECNNYSFYYKQYLNLIRTWENFNPYFDYLNYNKIVTDNPRQGIMLINTIEKDINNQIELSNLNSIIDDKKELLLSIEQVGGLDLKTLLERNNLINDEVSNLTNRQSIYISDRKDLMNKKLLILNIKDISNKIRKLMYDKKDLHKEQIETLRRIHFSNAIRELQSYLATKENILYNYNLQKTVSEDIKNQLIELEKHEKSISYLINILSPTEGLIAEGLLGFINVFVNQMNHFINKIWTYPLVVKPCGISDNGNVDIDYKFPLVVGNNKEEPVNDVSYGSTGMLEMINLAFRITAMQYLGLKNYPLGLDEWGSGFDTVHRDQAVNSIKALIDQNVFEQLFVISHYAESYGALSNPDICVLDDTNITLPKLNSKVNKNVIIS